MYFLTSDLHFGHSKIIELCSRPFSNVKEMTEGLISNYNEVVGNSDIVFNLGDMFFSHSSDFMIEVLSRLNGKMVLIMGNHDSWKRMENMVKLGYIESIHSDLYMNGMYLNHYPKGIWEGMEYGVKHAFGHVHGMGENILGACDVGVDVTGYFPVSFDMIRDRL
jgi:calcineurin-like phosphoesterase family protein